MSAVLGIHEAKTKFSQLVRLAASGTPVLIGGYGKAEVALVPVSQLAPQVKVLGVAKGRFDVPDDIDGCNDEIAKLFLSSQQP